MACKTKLDKCILDDGLSEVLEAVRTSDVLVMASPVYFGEVSSQMKAFIDRTFSFLVPDYMTNPKKSRLEPGKTLVFVLAQGNPDEKAFANIFPKYEFFFKLGGFEGHLIHACGMREAGDVKGRGEVLDLAAKTAEQIFSNT